MNTTTATITLTTQSAFENVLRIVVRSTVVEVVVER